MCLTSLSLEASISLLLSTAAFFDFVSLVKVVLKSMTRTTSFPAGLNKVSLMHSRPKTQLKGAPLGRINVWVVWGWVGIFFC